MTVCLLRAQKSTDKMGDSKCYSVESQIGEKNSSGEVCADVLPTNGQLLHFMPATLQKQSNLLYEFKTK